MVGGGGNGVARCGEMIYNTRGCVEAAAVVDLVFIADDDDDDDEDGRGQALP